MGLHHETEASAGEGLGECCGHGALRSIGPRVEIGRGEEADDVGSWCPLPQKRGEPVIPWLPGHHDQRLLRARSEDGRPTVATGTDRIDLRGAVFAPREIPEAGSSEEWGKPRLRQAGEPFGR